jgi:PPM family protein phosphatase
MVDDETILGEVERNRDDLKTAAKALVRAANKSGGEDNITVVFFEIAGDRETDGEHTVTLPEVRTDAGDEDDDTLDELDRVPAIEVDGHRPRKEEHRGRRGLLVALLAAVVLASASGFVVWGLWRSHFVGADADGRVTIYQGVPWNIVGNVHLYRPVYASPLLAAQLSRSERRELFDHTLRSEDSAHAAVRRYEDEIGAP